MKYTWIPFLIVNLFLLVGCGGGSASEPVLDAPQEPQPVPTQEIASTPDNILPQSTPQENIDFSNAPVEKFISIAKDDLARSLGITVEQVELVNAQAMTWLNSALGCPAPGKIYAQGQVPGYRIDLSANGQEYTYHTDLNGNFVLCPTIDQEEGLPMGPTTGPNIGVPIP
ncbi:MAG TPA: hypothetical protein PKE62_17640 [Anaerolineales bacterium]|nr:hypothetical protein [Anaerolineales bacterium]